MGIIQMKQTPEESRKEEVSQMNREARESRASNRRTSYTWDDEDGELNHNGRPISEHGE